MARRRRRRFGAATEAHEMHEAKHLTHVREFGERAAAALNRGDCGEAASAVFGMHGALSSALAHRFSEKNATYSDMRGIIDAADGVKDSFLRRCVKKSRRS